jgi:DNA polymerase III alpha subunit
MKTRFRLYRRKNGGRYYLQDDVTGKQQSLGTSDHVTAIRLLHSKNESLRHPLELFSEVAWDTYCPVNGLARHIGETVVTCGLVVEQRTHHQITGEPMKFLTLADWTGMVETELFAQTYKSYGLATVRYPVLEVTATVEPFENGRGFSLRVLRAGKPRSKPGSLMSKVPGIY